MASGRGFWLLLLAMLAFSLGVHATEEGFDLNETLGDLVDDLEGFDGVTSEDLAFEDDEYPSELEETESETDSSHDGLDDVENIDMDDEEDAAPGAPRARPVNNANGEPNPRAKVKRGRAESPEEFAARLMKQKNANEDKEDAKKGAQPDKEGKAKTKTEEEMTSREWNARGDKLGRLPLEKAERMLPNKVRAEVGELKRQNSKLKFLLNRAIRTEVRLSDTIRKHQGQPIPGFKDSFGSSAKLGSDVFGHSDPSRKFPHKKFDKVFENQGRKTKAAKAKKPVKKAASAKRAAALVQEAEADNSAPVLDVDNNFDVNSVFNNE